MPFSILWQQKNELTWQQTCNSFNCLSKKIGQYNEQTW